MDQQLIEEIVQRVVKEVLKELSVTSQQPAVNGFRNKSERLNFEGYKTPVITEKHIRHLHELTGEIIVPKKTIISPKARDVIREKGLRVRME